MYAVIASGGKQLRVEPGQQITVERLTGEPGEAINLRPVLVVDDAGEVTAGPALADRMVTATIVEHGKGRKIRVFTYKNKTRQRRTRGHRQHQTILKIESV